MANPHNLQVGQKLFRVSHWREGKSHTEITKVGRKYATTYHRERVDLETLKVDGNGYSSPAQCYLSQQAYEDWQAARRIEDRFKREVKWRKLPLATLEQIERIIAANMEKEEGK